MVLPNPASPPTTMPETSAERMKTERASSAQPSPSDGRDGGGDALVVHGDLGGREAVLAGPLIPVAEAEGLGQQRPLGGQPPSLAGPLPVGRLLGMAAIPVDTDHAR